MTLRQPFRGILALTDLLLKLGVGPTRDSVIARPAAERQRSKPPFWMTRPGDATVRAYDQVVSSRGGPLRLRAYVPTDLVAGGPALLYLHGGGFVMGGLDGCDYVARGLASRTGFLVVSVEYRLAPEYPFPGPLEDCEDALRWLVETCPEGMDPTRVAVAGDSAGGNLTAALCLLLRDNAGPVVRHQTLVYPFTDGSLSASSWHTHAGGGVDLDAGAAMMRYYAADTAYDHPLVSPLAAPDLSDLPPALVITAEVDVLHEDGTRYAHRLAEAGVPVVHRDYPGLPHGFVTMPRLCREADQALDLVAAELIAALAVHVP
jgi:acetyl esterase